MFELSLYYLVLFNAPATEQDQNSPTHIAWNHMPIVHMLW